mmetsp:Transcript_7756/g.17006  ORF Transcript_7756/g.17006 Transcript_7756/m.17006 type:complete len:218 (-) Transcript_7756:248-901(-)
MDDVPRRPVILRRHGRVFPIVPFLSNVAAAGIIIAVVVVVIVVGSPIEIDLTETKTRSDAVAVIGVAVPSEGRARSRPPRISMIASSGRDARGMPRRRRGGGCRGGEGSEMGRSRRRRGGGATTASFGAASLEGGTRVVGWRERCDRGGGGVDGRGCGCGGGFVVAVFVFVFDGALLCAPMMMFVVVRGAVVGSGREAAEKVSGTASSSGVVAVAAS